MPATITPTRTVRPSLRYMRVAWEGLAASGDVGAAVELGGYLDRSVQVLGSFATGGEVTIEGSNDGGTTYVTLTDPQGNSIVKTSAALEAVTEAVGLIRPRCSGGTAADIDVHLFVGGYTL